VLRVLQPPTGFRVTTATAAAANTTTATAAAAAGTRTAAYVHTIQAHEGPVFAAAHVASAATTSAATSATVKSDSPSRLSFVTGGVGGCARVWAVELGNTSSSSSSSSSIRVTALQELLVGGFQITCLAAGRLSSTAFNINASASAAADASSSGSAVILAGTLQGTVFAFRAPAIEVRRLAKHSGLLLVAA
jgi:hypothetical protein